eukprot:883091-Prorocentrum_lima.AAC.1
MTSSLVGSEMCIRDSFNRVVGLWLGVCELSGGCSCDGASCVTNMELAPVSYTHLTLPTICSV